MFLRSNQLSSCAQHTDVEEWVSFQFRAPMQIFSPNLCKISAMQIFRVEHHFSNVIHFSFSATRPVERATNNTEQQTNRPANPNRPTTFGSRRVPEQEPRRPQQNRPANPNRPTTFGSGHAPEQEPRRPQQNRPGDNNGRKFNLFQQFCEITYFQHVVSLQPTNHTRNSSVRLETVESTCQKFALHMSFSAKTRAFSTNMATSSIRTSKSSTATRIQSSMSKLYCFS